jgi:hypothetical protein
VHLLVIEDEDRLSGILKSKLGDVGFTVDTASSAVDANAALELINYDAAVLDLGLPDGDELAVPSAARRIGRALPILACGSQLRTWKSSGRITLRTELLLTSTARRCASRRGHIPFHGDSGRRDDVQIDRLRHIERDRV